MAIIVREASTDLHWQRALAVLHEVYGGEAYSTWERVQASMTREKMEGQGAFLVAMDEAESIMGATILLAPGSPLHQVAIAGEREFRMLGVSREARGVGAGEALVRACIDRAQAEGASGLVLWTQPTMKDAHRLYERLGFARASDRDDPDPRGFMRLVYRCVLPLA
jgi:ribosomal protein S18 acetylase RimI-like enzyme